MIAPRLQKVFKDLTGNKTRTVLVVLSILVGAFCVGLVSDAYTVLLQDIDNDYKLSNPNAAQIYTDPFGDEQLAAIRRIPEIESAEGRTGISARIQNAKGQWIRINLTVVPALDEMVVDRVRPLTAGAELKLRDKELFIDNSAQALLPVNSGDVLLLQLRDQEFKQMRVAGLVHDVAGGPSLFSGQVNGYINLNTLEWLGGNDQYSQLLLTVATNKLDQDHVKEVAALASAKLERAGIKSYATIITKPGESPVATVTKTLLIMLSFFGGLTVFLSAFLVVNTINSLMAQHIRQIGVMKAVGGRTRQILLMYIELVLGFGLVALAIAVPLAGVVNYQLVKLSAVALNFLPGPFRIPFSAILLQAGVALGVPLAASLVPILHGTGMTVREAISNYGMGSTIFGQSWFDRLLERVRALPRPLLISIRNIFRRKARLALTLSTLTLGGAIFIAVFSVKASFAVTIEQVLGYFLSDVNVSLNQLYRIEKVNDIVFSVPGVKRVETWGVMNTQTLTTGQSNATDVIVWAPPLDSQLIKPVITQGRWLVPGDQNAIVVGNHFLKLRPEVKIGDDLILKINDHDTHWTVVGFFLMAGNVNPPFVYVGNQYFSQMVGWGSRAFNYRIVTTSSEAGLQAQVAKELEQKFGQSGIQIGSMSTGSEEIARQNTSINILVYTLLVMALLIALVGGIGLTSTMSMNVMERTREIGMMRSIGASNFAILSMVVVEGMFIGGISWLLGSLLSLPISKLLTSVVGTSFVQLPLPFVFSTDGLVYWLVIVTVLAGIASLIPAVNAVRLTVCNILAYE